MRRLDELGWSYERHRATCLDAVSQYARRVIGSLDDLAAEEAESLHRSLARLISKHEPENYPVVLADEVERWREDWRSADPAGYDAAHPG